MNENAAMTLGASQKAGKFVNLPWLEAGEIKPIKAAFVREGWMDRKTERLSFDGMVAEGAMDPVEPEEEPEPVVEAPVVPEEPPKPAVEAEPEPVYEKPALNPLQEQMAPRPAEDGELSPPAPKPRRKRGRPRRVDNPVDKPVDKPSDASSDIPE